MSVSFRRKIETDKADTKLTNGQRPLLVCPKRSVRKPALSDLATMVGILGSLSACMGGGGGGGSSSFSIGSSSSGSSGIGNLGSQTGISPSPAVMPRHDFHMHSDSHPDTSHFDFNGELDLISVIGTEVTVFAEGSGIRYKWFRDGVSTGYTGNSYELKATDAKTVLSVEITYNLDGEVHSSHLEQTIGLLAFAGEAESVSSASPADLHEFSHQGDFIDSGKDEISILNIESTPHGSHDEETKAVFEAYAPLDLHGEYRQIYEGDTNAVISQAHVSGATIIVVPSDAMYNFDDIIEANRDDVVVLISAGNKGEAMPLASGVEHYQDNLGSNIFFVGGYYEPNALDADSAKPGTFDYAYISGRYHVVNPLDSGKQLSGTSYAVQEVAAKLAVLYEALNEHGDWSLADTMALLMTSRHADSYAPDLHDFLVKNSNGEVYTDSFGKTHLLPDDDLRGLLTNQSMTLPSPAAIPDYHFSTLSFPVSDPATDTASSDFSDTMPTQSFDDFLSHDHDHLMI